MFSNSLLVSFDDRYVTILQLDKCLNVTWVVRCAGKWDNMKGGAVPRLKGANYFSFDDMKRLTNNFSEDNLLGEGGYGKVCHVYN